MTAWVPTDGILDEIYSAMDSEADMDGLCIATLGRIGEVAGRPTQTVLYSIDALVKLGRVVIVERKRGVKEWTRVGDQNFPTYSVGEYQLTEYL